jgi:hypothetical protein
VNANSNCSALRGARPGSRPAQALGDNVGQPRGDAELEAVIIVTGKVSGCARAELKSLETELKRAEIVAPDEIPPDVITMNSRAELLDLESGERMELTLVLPADANIHDGNISVLAPLGIGCRVGDEFV